MMLKFKMICAIGAVFALGLAIKCEQTNAALPSLLFSRTSLFRRHRATQAAQQHPIVTNSNTNSNSNSQNQQQMASTSTSSSSLIVPNDLSRINPAHHQHLHDLHQATTAITHQHQQLAPSNIANRAIGQLSDSQLLAAAVAAASSVPVNMRANASPFLSQHQFHHVNQANYPRQQQQQQQIATNVMLANNGGASETQAQVQTFDDDTMAPFDGLPLPAAITFDDQNYHNKQQQQQQRPANVVYRQQQFDQNNYQQHTTGNQMRNLEPAQTNEIVDKIERHIGQQIESSLSDGNQEQQQTRQAAASGYEKEETSSAGQQQGAEQQQQQQEEEGSSGGEPEQSNKQEEASKQHEEHQQQQQQQQEEPAQHHEEHPPEAFEVHHKKGGKSYQYFHQKHSS